MRHHRQSTHDSLDVPFILVGLANVSYTYVVCSVVPNHANGYLNQNQNHTFKNDLKSNQNHIL